MDILDRRLKQDAWAASQLLLRGRDLTEDQLNQQFDLGPGTLRARPAHMVENMEVWTDLMTVIVTTAVDTGRVSAATRIRLPLFEKEAL